MGLAHSSIQWNRQKKLYDLTMVSLIAGAGVLFAGTTAVLEPDSTAETLLIRTTANLALLMLHVILCIGPLARLDRRFAPLLYNRRHLGVTMFLLALSHGLLATIQFHALGDTNPLVSVFTAYADDYWLPAAGLARVPFEPFGVLALLGLFVMAATSHDFWLKNLGASLWKLAHLSVYFAYGCVLVHLCLGAFQDEQIPGLAALVIPGFLAVTGLHLAAGVREVRRDRTSAEAAGEGFFDACAVSDLREGCGHTVVVGGSRIALFLQQGRVYALSNVCRHQGGPIGEGRIVDGCVTCPWHGWNYKAEDGCSPPPFEEILPTYPVRIEKDRVWVNPQPNPLKTKAEGAAARQEEG